MTVGFLLWLSWIGLNLAPTRTEPLYNQIIEELVFNEC